MRGLEWSVASVSAILPDVFQCTYCVVFILYCLSYCAEYSLRMCRPINATLLIVPWWRNGRASDWSTWRSRVRCPVGAQTRKGPNLASFPIADRIISRQFHSFHLADITRRRSDSAYIRQDGFGDGDGLHEGDGWWVVGRTHTEEWTECAHTHTHRHTKLKTVYPPVSLHSLRGYNEKDVNRRKSSGNGPADESLRQVHVAVSFCTETLIV